MTFVISVYTAKCWIHPIGPPLNGMNNLLRNNTKGEQKRRVSHPHQRDPTLGKELYSYHY